MTNKALSQVDKYVKYAVEKYHGTKIPSKIINLFKRTNM